MPFDKLPGHDIQVPNLYPLVNQNVDRPVFNTQAVVANSFEQINKILDDMDPLVKEEKKAKIAEIRYKLHLFQHPEDVAKAAALKDPLYRQKAQHFDDLHKSAVISNIKGARDLQGSKFGKRLSSGFMTSAQAAGWQGQLPPTDLGNYSGPYADTPEYSLDRPQDDTNELETSSDEQTDTNEP